MIKKITLDNGVRVVCEKITYVRSVTVGIWIGIGSRNENTKINGISHFIEHMVFKGTDRRSSKDIAESIDNIGGQINAFTGKECTCYYTKTLDEHIEIALDILADMLFHSRFNQRDINVERKVILEEIGMYEDALEELVHDMLSENIWQGNSLGYPILGTEKCLKKINRDSIQQYMSDNYLPGNSVIAVAGNYDEGRLMELIEKYFGGWKPGKLEKQGMIKPEFKPCLKMKEKDSEQVHICMGFNGIQHGDDRLYPLLAVNNLLGGGMSSRLFQKIREKQGLVYSVYSYPSSYRNAGLFSIYAGMNPEQLERVTELILKEVRKLVREGISSDELAKAKEQMKGSYILGLESTSSRMNSMGKSELLLGYVKTPEEILKKIEGITLESISDVINQIFDLKHISLAAVGNIKNDTDLQKFIS